jgi:heme/copper-type cytochrome/quinol oxidase subunit 2
MIRFMIMHKKIDITIAAVVGILVLLPTIVYAQTPGIIGFIQIFLAIFNWFIAFLVALALVLFVWGVVKYIASQDDPTGRSAARSQIINGIVMLFVIISVWGLVNILAATFNLNNQATPPTVPSVPGGGGGGGFGGICVGNICPF